MQIRHVIIKVDDQEKALSFYTSVVGFVKKLDFPAGPVRWLTVSSPEGAEGAELPVTSVPFEDTCGNLIVLVQPEAIEQEHDQ